MDTATRPVAFTQTNVAKCRCGACPVQEDSACATGKTRSLTERTGVRLGVGPVPADDSDAYRTPQGLGSDGMQGPGLDTGIGAQGRGNANLPGAASIPGVYCASGAATCDDLTFERPCVCPACLVWQEHDLGGQKYCRKGSAAVIG